METALQNKAYSYIPEMHNFTIRDQEPLMGSLIGLKDL